MALKFRDAPDTRPREAAVYRERVLSRAEIDKIIEHASGLEEQKATVGGVNADEESDVDLSRRDSSVRWIDASDSEMAWLFMRIKKTMISLNNLYFRANVDWDFQIRLQFAEYDTSSGAGFYFQHSDMPWRALKTVERKLSCSVLLSDPSEHDGGELIVGGTRLAPGPQSEAGTLIAFPSYLPHEVTPVTRGLRRSLVAWYIGPLWN